MQEIYLGSSMSQSIVKEHLKMAANSNNKFSEPEARRRFKQALMGALSTHPQPLKSRISKRPAKQSKRKKKPGK
jgi:hypothetical protein